MLQCEMSSLLLVINFFKLGGSSRSRFSFFKRALLVKSLVELERLPSLLWPELLKRERSLFKSGRSGMKEIAKIASNRENNHTGSKNTPCI